MGNVDFLALMPQNAKYIFSPLLPLWHDLFIHMCINTCYPFRGECQVFPSIVLEGGEIYLQLYCLIMPERLSILKRVVQHLIAIEVEAESIDNQVPGHSSIPLQGWQPVVNSDPPTGRTRKNVAVRGEVLRRKLLRFWLWDYLTTEVCQKWGVWESFDWHFWHVREHFVIPFMAW